MDEIEDKLSSTEKKKFLSFKNCPYCHKEIHLEIIKCNYCGKIIDNTVNNMESGVSNSLNSLIRRNKVDIISNNAFRILGLSITASDKEILRKFDELLTFHKIGKASIYNNDFEWISELNRSEESLRKAFHILQTSDEKIKHAIFWFWEDNEIDKMALSSLQKRNLIQALKIWEQAIDNDEKHPISYDKNLATLSFIYLVIDIKKSISDNITYLKKCFDYWDALLEKSQFWDAIDNRFLKSALSGKEQDDLKSGILSSIHSAIVPFIEIKSNVEMKTKRYYLNCVASSKFPQNTKLGIIDSYISPISSEIVTACTWAKKERATSPEDALETAEKLLEDTQKPLGVIKTLLSDTDESVISLHDMVTKEVCLCCMDYSNETGSVDEAKLILLKAKETAMGVRGIDRIDSDLERLDKLKEEKKIYSVIDRIYKKIENYLTRLEAVRWTDSYKIGKAFAIGLKNDLEKVGRLFDYSSNEYKTVVLNCVNFVRRCAIEGANDYRQYIRGEELIDIALNLIRFKYTDGKIYVIDSKLANQLYDDKMTLANNISNANSFFGSIGRAGFRMFKRNQSCPCGSGKKYKDCCFLKRL